VAYNTFTITQVTYDFTATLTVPLSLALQTTSTVVDITETTSTIVVTNAIQPVTVSNVGLGGYNQSLNTTDNVQFATISTLAIYGIGQQPVLFPNGIIAQEFNSLDFVNPNDP